MSELETGVNDTKRRTFKMSGTFQKTSLQLRFQVVHFRIVVAADAVFQGVSASMRLAILR